VIAGVRDDELVRRGVDVEAGRPAEPRGRGVAVRESGDAGRVRQRRDRPRVRIVGVGALLMATYLVHRPIKRHLGKILLSSVAGFGLAMIMFALSTNFWLSLFVLILSGAFDGVSVIARSTLLQTLTPENMKGRVSAVNNIFIGSSNEIGSFESGVAARLLGTVPSVLFGGCMTIFVVAITGWKAKKLRNLQQVS
jgi:MFS family permease